MSPKVSNLDNDRLLQPLSAEEIKWAAFQMHLDKAPGLDGMNSAFFQKFSNIVSNDVVQ